MTIQSTDQSASGSSSDAGLVRVLGAGMAIAIVVGNTIGSGIFAKPGRIAAEAGDFGLIISIWGVGALLCVLGALCIAELSVMLPRAGGLYVYLREGYGRLPAFLFGWQEIVLNRPASTGALSMICVGAFGNAIGISLGPIETVAGASLVIAGMTAVNVFGVIWGGRMQVVTTVIKCGFVVFVATLPFVLELGGRDVIDASLYSLKSEPKQPGLGGQIAAVLLAVMWAYNGWHGIAPVAEEVREPQRNIPLALFGGIGLLALFYIGANIAYHAVIPMSEMALPENQEHVAELMVQRLLGPIGGSLMSVGVMLSTLGAVNSNLLISPRVAFAMGRDRVFFSRFADVHARFRTPVIAILVQGLLAIGLVIASAILVASVEYFRDRSVFSLLTDCVIFVSSIFYVLAVGAVVVLRRKRPDLERPYRTPFYPLVPAAYLAVYAWFLFNVFLGQPAEALIGFGMIAAGLPVYRWFAGRASHEISGV